MQKDSKDPLVQLETSTSGIEDLFKDLLDKIKAFKYQITVKFLLSKHNAISTPLLLVVLLVLLK